MLIRHKYFLYNLRIINKLFVRLDRNENGGIMRKRIGLLVLTLCLMMTGISVHAAGKDNTKVFSKYLNLFFDEVKGVQSEESISSLKDSVGELVKNIRPEDAKRIINFINEKIDEGKWETKEGIDEAIAEGEKEFNVTLTKEQKDMILSVVEKIKKPGIAPEYIMEQATKIYEKYGADLKEEISESSQEMVEETQNRLKEEIDKSITDYFSDMVNNVKLFFKGIFKK